MSKTRNRPAADRANPENESRKRTTAEYNRIPPRTPDAVAKQLTRLYRRCDDLADTGVHISISLAYRDSRGELCGILIASPEVARFAVDLMSDGVLIAEVGTVVQHA